MAADFWASSQFKHLISKSDLKNVHNEDRARGLTMEQVDQIKHHFYTLIVDLSRSAKLRQRVAAAAMNYFRRFYVRNCFCNVDPRLVAPGCLYVSSKCEESIIQAKHLVAYMKKLRPTWPYDVHHLLEMEMILLEGLDYNLVAYSPNKPLTQYLAVRELSDLELAKDAWALLNDSYRTDICVIYPPYIIALACIQLAAAISKKDISSWLDKLLVDLNHVADAVVELCNMYGVHIRVISMDECNQLLEKIK